MIVIETNLDPLEEIIVASGLAESISGNPEVLGVTVYDKVFAVEATEIWSST